MQDRLRRCGSLVVVLLSVLFINAGHNPPSPAYTPAVTPPLPSIMRDVSLVQGGTQAQAGSYMYPYVPPFRTSADGRVAIGVRQLGAGGAVNFYLFVPEAINQQSPPLPFRLTKAMTPPMIFPSTSIMQQLTVSQLGLDTAISNGYLPQHNTICDPTVQDLNNPPPSPNPYLCGPGGADDCYTLFVISPMSNGTKLVIYSTPVVVEVTQPKQIGAHIISLTPQLPATFTPTPIPIGNKNNPSESNLLEPMITTDGHLFVGRIQESSLTWKNNSGTPVTGNYNIVYSVGSATDYAPCDVRQWTNFYPIAHAYNDPNMNGGRYGLADYQFRDPENHLIPETADIEGDYPWIDRMGRNLFFTHVAAMLFNTDSSSSTGVMARYTDAYTDSCLALNNCTPDPCVATACGIPPVPISTLKENFNTRGLAMAGRWTHGKMVQLDGLVNNIDYGLRIPDSAQRMITLYSSGDPIRFGSGSNNELVGNPPDYPEDITINDSLENIFNYVATLKPISLREVSWQVNMGKGGDEIPFDDYLNPEAFIVSDMTASTSWAQYNYPRATNGYSSSATPPAANYADGFTAPPSGGFNAQIHLQNSATSVSSQWNIPLYGLVKSSTGNITGVTARIEPAALGGIKGKGFWLGQDGNYVSYAIPSSQPQSVMQTPWFISLFVDSRCCSASGDTTHRRILTFPDGSYLNIVGSSALEIGYPVQRTTTKISGTLPGPLNLPIPQGWWHIAFQVVPDTQNNGQTDTLGVYINGYLLKTYQTNAPLFQILPPTGTCPAAGCQVTLGGDPNTADNVAGFTGWLDEFKVIAQNVDYETICNHAHGTIVGSNSSWGDVTSYPQSGPTSETTLINQLTNQTLKYYGCVVNYSSDASATYLPAFSLTTGNLPLGTTSMRDVLHFPEGPLHYDQLRPDSTGNKFCGSCHTDNGGQASQTLSNKCALGQLSQTLINQCSLAAQPTTLMWQDPRRQPMNPQRLVYGNVPNTPVPYFNGQQPTQKQTITGAGISLDQWVFPD